jgi:prepilin-type N-terminal cleavage/methylation domain-containing protein
MRYPAGVTARMQNPRASSRRIMPRIAPRGFTVAETVIALAILAVIVTLVAELGLASLLERQRNGRRQVALEAAVNFLETARASDWEMLTPEWARTQQLPSTLAERLPQGKLQVQAEQEKGRALCKRITVEIQWTEDAKPVRPVKLVMLRSARTTPKPGGKP